MANLGEVRELFIRHGGRSDLVDEDGNDAGADFFINAGQRFLDRLFRFPKDEGRLILEMAAGDYFVQVGRARSIKEVWAFTNQGRTLLTKIDRRELEEHFGAKPYNELDRGVPLYWAPAVVNAMKRTPQGGVIGFQADLITRPGKNDITGLLILPPPSEGVRLDIRGLFYSPELKYDHETSYWAQNEPFILMMAAMRAVEITYRNTEGANDWLRAIRDEYDGIDKDMVEDDITDVNQLEG